MYELGSQWILMHLRVTPCGLISASLHRAWLRDPSDSDKCDHLYVLIIDGHNFSESFPPNSWIDELVNWLIDPVVSEYLRAVCATPTAKFSKLYSSSASESISVFFWRFFFVTELHPKKGGLNTQESCDLNTLVSCQLELSQHRVTYSDVSIQTK